MVIAIYAVVHQGVAGVENILHLIYAVALLALENKITGKHHVVDNAIGTGPLFKQIIVFKKGIVAVTGMGNNQGLHGHGVIFHQIGYTRIRVDNNFVSKPLLPLFVGLAIGDKLLSVTPVWVAHGQPGIGIGIQHLLEGDYLDLVGKGIQFKFIVGDIGDGFVIGFK